MAIVHVSIMSNIDHYSSADKHNQIVNRAFFPILYYVQKHASKISDTVRKWQVNYSAKGYVIIYEFFFGAYATACNASICNKSAPYCLFAAANFEVEWLTEVGSPEGNLTRLLDLKFL